MRRHFWRYSRPVGCCLCLLFLLFLAWFLRWVNGVPPMEAEAVVRRIERQYLRPAGELVQVIEEGNDCGAAVTRYDGELYTYVLYPAERFENKRPARYTGGQPNSDTEHGFSWGCTTSPFYFFDTQSTQNPYILACRYYVLVKQADPLAVSGKLEIHSTLEEHSRTWKSQAKRTCPYYLAFPLELAGGTDIAKEIYQSILNGCSADRRVAAEAVAVFFDAEGNEVSRITFSMIRDTADQEGSEENGA